MNDLKKHKYALSFILLLVLLKFVLLPWYEWQNSLSASNKLLSSKVEKSELLIENAEQIKTAIDSQGSQLKELASFFYNSDSNDQVKLEIQKQLENQLKVFELQKNSIGWQNTYRYPEYPVKKHLLSVSFSGDTYQAIQFLLMLSKSKKINEYENFSFNLLRQQEGGLGRVNVTMRIAFFELTKELT